MLYVHDKRFFIRASFAVPAACNPWATCVDRCFVPHTCRSGGDWCCAGRIWSGRPADHLGARLCRAPRKRAALYAGSAGLTGYPTNFACHRQPSARCAVGNGRGRELRGSVCGHRRGAWRASRIGFHRHQTFGYAGRDLWRTALSNPQRRSWCAQCSACAVARGIVAVPAQPARPTSPWQGAMGLGFVPGARPQSGPLGGAL